MKFWVSKYALTQGILEVEAEEPSAGMLVVRPWPPSAIGYATYYHGEGKEWHRTRDGATIRANIMVARKIVSLRQQLKNYETMVF